MKDFIKVVKEIERTLDFFIIFDSILNAALFFLAVYFLLALINLYPIMAIIPALIYFAIRMYVNLKKDKRRIVEGKYAPLREKLRTAADNIDEDNPVVNELDEEVISELKNVGLSSFIQTRKVSYKILAGILLSFAIVLAAMTNLYVVDVSDFLNHLPDTLGKLGIKKSDSALNPNISDDSNIYGESKLAILGDKQVDIRIKPVNYEVNVREDGNAEQKQFDEISPNDIAVKQASASDEKIPEEQQELVKKYFDKLANR